MVVIEQEDKIIIAGSSLVAIRKWAKIGGLTPEELVVKAVEDYLYMIKGKNESGIHWRKCEACGEGEVVEREVENYVTEVAGMKLTLPVAIVGTCNKCGYDNYAFRKDVLKGQTEKKQR